MTDNAIAEQVELRLAKVMELLHEVQDLQPATPVVFYALGEKKYFSRCGLDYIQLGMLEEMKAVIILPSARAFHAIDAQKKKSPIIQPSLVPVSTK
jgi:hypothetical protein